MAGGQHDDKEQHYDSGNDARELYPARRADIPVGIRKRVGHLNLLGTGSFFEDSSIHIVLVNFKVSRLTAS
jgi:hypothetical protein